MDQQIKDLIKENKKHQFIHEFHANIMQHAFKMDGSSPIFYPIVDLLLKLVYDQSDIELYVLKFHEENSKKLPLLIISHKDSKLDYELTQSEEWIQKFTKLRFHEFCEETSKLRQHVKNFCSDYSLEKFLKNVLLNTSNHIYKSIPDTYIYYYKSYLTIESKTTPINFLSCIFKKTKITSNNSSLFASFCVFDECEFHTRIHFQNCIIVNCNFSIINDDTINYCRILTCVIENKSDHTELFSKSLIQNSEINTIN